jgi:hypothetical protein
MKEGELCMRLEASLADGKALEGLPGDKGTAQTQAHLAQHGPYRTHTSKRDRDADRRRKDDYPLLLLLTQTTGSRSRTHFFH